MRRVEVGRGGWRRRKECERRGLRRQQDVWNFTSKSVFEAKGLFHGIGHSPNCQSLEGQVEIDEVVYVGSTPCEGEDTCNRNSMYFLELTSLLLSNIAGDCRDVESFPDEDLLSTSLTQLSIVRFQNLRSLDKKGLQHLTSNQRLGIIGCPELKHMPEEGLLVSISHLRIKECPTLTI
nr:putative disease resistance protein [Quercus suber]